MPNIAEQKIVVICDFSEKMKDVILHGVRMADILSKEVCLVAFWKNKNQRNEIHDKIVAATRNLKHNLPAMAISSLLLQNSLYENMHKLADEYNAVLVVLHQNDIRFGLKAFRESNIGFLFVNGSLPEFLNYKNVLIPVDYRKASKENALWASYLGRFNHSTVRLIYAHETDREELGKLNQNLNFIQKFLSSLQIKHESVQGKSSSWGIFKETLTNASKWHGDVMIFAGSTYISLIDLIIGLPEEKIIRKAGNLPILIINPLRETCILCD